MKRILFFGLLAVALIAGITGPVSAWDPIPYGNWYRNETKIFAPSSSDAAESCGPSYDLCGPGQNCWVYVLRYAGYSGGTDWSPVETEWLDWYMGLSPTVEVFAYCYSGGTYVYSGHIGYWDVNLTDYYTDPPVCSFAAEPGSGFIPLEVTFTDTSLNASSWYWDFGDGNTSAERNPHNTFVSAGNYPVRLTASNSAGGNMTEDYVAVLMPDPPIAEFTASPTSGYNRLNVQFTDNSTGPPASWYWDFGDSGTSTEQNPQHTYTAVGTYTVQLNVTNAAGSDSETKTGYITVNGWEPIDYGYWYRNETKTFAPSSSDAADSCAGYDLCGPGQSCWVYVNRWGGYSGGTDWSPVETEWLANWMDMFSTLDVDAYCYSGGTYVYTGLIGYWEINLTEYQSVPPVASFTAEPGSGYVPLEVTFTDTSTNATSWSWDFGDGNTSADQNPQHTYISTGNYTVRLTAANSAGSDTAEDSVTVIMPDPPAADFTASPTSGDNPLTVQFTDNSTGPPASWSWDFENDGTIDSTDQNPQHTYAAVGTYTVQLNVTNAAGSDSETKTEYITVTGWEPKNYGYWYRNETKTFAPNSSDAVTVCAGYDLCGPGQSCWVYVNGYGGYSGGTDWLPVQTEWLDWYLAPFPTLHVFAYCYSGGTYVNAGYFGYWDINLTEYYADPPSCSFTAEPGSGAAPLEVTFTDTSTNATSWSWDFGDGNTSADQNPQHTYAFAGNFTASLTVSNYWGSDSAEKYILVGSSPPVADFTATPTNGARPLTVQFTDTSTGSPTSWEWDFDNDGTVDSNAQNPEHVYSDAGVYSVNLTVTNSAGSDSMIRQSYITVTTGTTTYTVFVEGINEYHGTQDPLTSAIDIANTFHDNIVGSINNGAVWEDYYEFYDDNTGSKHWTVSESSLIKADYADFALFAGHGEHDRIYFGTQNNVLEPTLSDMSFGESKLKWLTFSACKVLNESTWTDWKPVFNGLHILNGYDTLGWLNGTQGGIYAAYLKGGTYGGDLYPLRNIRDGWMYTLKDTIYINDAYYNGAWMWAEPCGGDYLPGYGEFCTFPTKDSNGNYTVLYDKFDCV